MSEYEQFEAWLATRATLPLYPTEQGIAWEAWQARAAAERAPLGPTEVAPTRERGETVRAAIIEECAKVVDACRFDGSTDLRSIAHAIRALAAPVAPPQAQESASTREPRPICTTGRACDNPGLCADSGECLYYESPLTAPAEAQPVAPPQVPSAVPRDLLPLIEVVASRWQKGIDRYERCGSDQHNTMPGHWPVDVTVTNDMCRAAHRYAVPQPALMEKR